MVFESVNWLAVVAAAVAYFVIGMLWYSPLLFVNAWMRLAKVKPNKGSMVTSMLGGALTSLVTSAVLAAMLVMTAQTGAYAGALLALWVWFGFVGTTTLGIVLWEGKPFSLWLLNNGYNLIGLVIIGLILGAWM